MISMHSAVVLVIAIMIGGVVGLLTYLGAGVLPAAFLAGLFAAGVSTPVLRREIGN
ncbi:hypothetical protein [Streptomyces sp. NPDC012508]|uniref:hypothetical protein n=1 Tax=Streptomyces sp. NPDC012508 TaxID=3364837 RepID=UPI0036CF0166